MAFEKKPARALRYRKLALAEHDKERASLLNRIADEAERGVLPVDGLHPLPGIAVRASCFVATN